MTPTRTGVQAPVTEERCLAFGPFVLYPHQQVLLREGKTVSLGSRAMSLLLALAGHPGELVEKQTLMRLAWPRAVVEECNLRAQVVALRKALGEGDGVSYIATVPGRGYRFIAPINAASPATLRPPMAARVGLPALATQVIGRTAEIQALGQRLLLQRFVTLTGAGGIGKTTLAVATAWQMLADFSLGAAYVDLTSATDANEVEAALAEGWAAYSNRSVAQGELRFLLVLDHPEQALEPLAGAVQNLLGQRTNCYVLVCSREPLHALGEQVQTLSPLALPSAPHGLTLAEAMAYPSVELLVSRIVAHNPGFTLQAPDSSALTALCQQLDGNPLALEIVAARARAFALHDLVGLLEGNFCLHMTGLRGTVPRHRSLAASHDWTYASLTEAERCTFRQLGVFSGVFSLGAAKATVETASRHGVDVASTLEALVGKSLLMPVSSPEGKGFCLAQATRLYAREKLDQHRETHLTAARQARFVKAQLSEAVTLLDRLPASQWLSRYAPQIDGVRTALQWAFSEGAEPGLGVELTVLSAPLWLRVSKLREGQAWIDTGLLRAEHCTLAPTGARMQLRTLAASLLSLTEGGGTQVRHTWNAVLLEAQACEDAPHQLRALWGLWHDAVISGQGAQALVFAQRYLALDAGPGEGAGRLMGKRMQAVALFYQADLAGARKALGEALEAPVVPASHLIDVHFDQRLAARALQAQVQLLEGHHRHGLLLIAGTVHDAIGLNHPATLWYCLCYSALPLALLAGTLSKATEYLELLEQSLGEQPFALWLRYSQCFACVLRLRTQADEATVTALGGLLGELREHQDTPLYALFAAEHAQGLAALGLPQWGLDALEHALERVRARREHWFLPELLRLRASLLRRSGASRQVVCTGLHQARVAAEAQGAGFWAARVSADLAALRGQRGTADSLNAGPMERAG